MQREIRIYDELIKKGIEIYFLTYGDSNDRKWEPYLNGIKVIPVYERLKKSEYKIYSLIQTLLIPWIFKNEFKNVDILKTNQIMGSWVAVLVKLFFNKSLIIRCGYDLYEFSKKNNSKYLIKMFSYLVSYIGFKLSTRIHVATYEDALNIQNNFKITKAKIFVLPNWIDTKIFYTFIEDKPSKILFVGRLTYQKNITLLIKALENTQYELDVVGEGDKLEDLKNEALSRNVKINFLGKVPNNDLPKIYNNHAVYVLCSHFEGNPKTLLEAMACGCAVIGTDVSGINTVIKNNINGLLVPKDHLSIRYSINMLMNSRNLRLVLSENAQKTIIQEYSLPGILKNEFNAYTDLIKHIK